ncbi:hypothetical protein PHMEG_00040817 [Phytophthora megakarya]|uniref:Uncharacterized protein n=1 Tax=Phytophthora megakarya TaxID=4795 RepID=A0A225UD71_9STRA|nr:hypothetical protein PHMEG_00040817 [Phytophthora megakarya]
MDPPITPRSDGHIVGDEDDDREGEIAPVVVVSKETAAAARDAEFHALFPSDSDDEDTSASKKRVIRRVKKISAKEIKDSQRVETEGADTETRVIRREKKKSAKEVKENQRAAAVVDEDSETAGATNKETSHSDLDDSAQPKESASAAEDGNVADASLPATNDENTMQCKQNEETLDIYALKPIKPSASGVEVKRARVRSALVSDRVKQTRLPDLSFFPSGVVQICQRLPHYHGRSVILDESDYDSYVDTHEQFRQDWEVLDKVSG